MSSTQAQKLSLGGTMKIQLAHPPCILVAQNQLFVGPASMVHYKFILKPQFIRGYIPFRAKKFLLYNF